MSRAFPERRLFLRSDTETRFVRLSPLTQVVTLSGSALLVGWTIIASAAMMMDAIGSGGIRDQVAREQSVYESRLNALSTERDKAVSEAVAAHERFGTALDQVSLMQSELLRSEARREELERGITLARDRLKDAILDRDEARGELAAVVSADADERARRLTETEATLDAVVAALESTAGQRDDLAEEAQEADAFAEELLRDASLKDQRQDRILTQLEEALTISVEPLDKMFRAAGLDTDSLIGQVRRSYSGQGGPLTPIRFSTKGEQDEASTRANAILGRLDEMNLYRLAAEKAPFAMPVHASFRYTSGFGQRWGRMHEGVDMAGATGTPIYATGDGVVIHAARLGAYGNLVKIRHDFGIETRYAHLSSIDVKKGQRVSRGDRIGGMGTTGRSTGTHLHYEVRVGGKAVNPMTYIKAARDVF